MTMPDHNDNLREALLERGFPVYGTFSQYANCGGDVEVDVVPTVVSSQSHPAIALGVG